MMEIEEMRRSGSSPEEVAAFLHGSNYTIIESMRALVGISGMSLGQAKRIVTSLPCWSVEVEIADELHDRILRDIQNAVPDVMIREQDSSDVAPKE